MVHYFLDTQYMTTEKAAFYDSGAHFELFCNDKKKVIYRRATTGELPGPQVHRARVHGPPLLSLLLSGIFLYFSSGNFNPFFIVPLNRSEIIRKLQLTGVMWSKLILPWWERGRGHWSSFYGTLILKNNRRKSGSNSLDWYCEHTRFSAIFLYFFL